jgi:hypothetical protein
MERTECHPLLASVPMDDRKLFFVEGLDIGRVLKVSFYSTFDVIYISFGIHFKLLSNSKKS